jgi:hypothetical protein
VQAWDSFAHVGYMTLADYVEPPTEPPAALPGDIWIGTTAENVQLYRKVV